MRSGAERRSVVCGASQRRNASRSAVTDAAPYRNQPVQQAELHGTRQGLQLVPTLADLTAHQHAVAFKGFTALHAAAQGGNAAHVAQLLRAQHSPLAQTAAHRLPLHLACKGGHLDAARLLAAAAPHTIVHQDNTGRTPLHVAAASGSTGAAGALLAAERRHGARDARLPDVASLPDKAGMLPLHVASKRGHAAVVRLLLDAAPETVAATDMDGNTALHLAAAAGHLAVATVLLAALPGAASALNSQHAAPMHLACKRGHSVVALALLAAAPQAAHVRTRASCTALHLAAAEGMDAVIAAMLPLPPGVPHAVTLSGATPLHLAAEAGHASTVRLLLQAGSGDAMVADTWGHLPVHRAAASGHAAVLQLLLDALPETVVARSRVGHTPLAVALRFRRIAAACFLFRRSSVRTAAVSLEMADDADLCFFAKVVAACLPLSAEQWQRVPPHCPGLGNALPAALAHSRRQVALLVARLPADDKRRLRAAALCLVRLRKTVHLPALAAQQVLPLVLRD